MRVLEQLQPKRVFHYFENICAIPHGSGNTDAISEYCVDFAAKHSLSCERDEHNNVIIRKPASMGKEHLPTVVLQGHLDMVCEQDADSPINMQTDGLQLGVDGDWVFAHGTTLGGDDGIAVAMVLAILEDKTLLHPAIEALFTTDEETGMYGAAGLDGTRITGRTLMNIDSEEEGVLTVGCAGGARVKLSLPVTYLPLETTHCVRVSVTGLAGGHSGVEIHKNRLNANKVLAEFLHSLSCEWQLVSIGGGQKDNTIPRESAAVICVNEDIRDLAKSFEKTHCIENDPNLCITVTPDIADHALSYEDSCRVVDFLCTLPNGVQSMTEAIPDLVQTSLNLGVLTMDSTLTAVFAVRSSSKDEKQALITRLCDIAAAFDGESNVHGDYPAWEYREVSPLRDTMTQVYRRLYGKDMAVEIIHAGLECGLLSEKLEGLDAVSFGPNMRDIHTSRERLSISSVGRTFAFLCEVLQSL